MNVVLDTDIEQLLTAGHKSKIVGLWSNASGDKKKKKNAKQNKTKHPLINNQWKNVIYVLIFGN